MAPNNPMSLSTSVASPRTSHIDKPGSNKNQIVINIEFSKDSMFQSSMEKALYYMMKDSRSSVDDDEGFMTIYPQALFRIEGMIPNKALLKPTKERSTLTQKILQRNRKYA